MSLNDHFWGDEKSFVAGFLRGYRAWKVDSACRRLQSTSYPNIFWEPGVNVADCQNKVSGLFAATVLHCLCVDCAKNKDKILAMQAEKAERFKNHRPPSQDVTLCNTCGFYAFNSPKMLNRELGGYIPANIAEGHDGAIFGSIKATGRIIVGTLGFRAERVEVEALYGRSRLQLDYGPAVAAVYGVPWFNTEEELAQAYPPTPVAGIEYETANPTITVPVGNAGSIALTTWANVRWYTVAPEPEPEPEPEMLVLESGKQLRIDYNGKRWPLLPKLDPRSWFWKAPPDGNEP